MADPPSSALAKAAAIPTPKAAEQKRDPDVESFEAFMTEFISESDRAAVVLGAARIDAALYDLLVAFLQPAPDANDSLLDGDSPLATFSAKINLAYRLGLIDAQCSRALHLVRKIRNSFAHDVQGCSLTAGAHGDRVRELARPLHKWHNYPRWCEAFGGTHKGLSLDFRMVVAMTVAHMDQLLGLVRRVKPLDLQFYPTTEE